MLPKCMILNAAKKAAKAGLGKAPSVGVGMWRTTQDGAKIYIGGGNVHAGGPNGPVLKGKGKKVGKPTMTTPKPKKDETLKELEQRSRFMSSDEIRGEITKLKGEIKASDKAGLKAKNKTYGELKNGDEVPGKNGEKLIARRVTEHNELMNRVSTTTGEVILMRKDLPVVFGKKAPPTRMEREAKNKPLGLVSASTGKDATKFLDGMKGADFDKDTIELMFDSVLSTGKGTLVDWFKDNEPKHAKLAERVSIKRDKEAARSKHKKSLAESADRLRKK